MQATSLAHVLPAAAVSIGHQLDPELDPLGEFSHAVVLLVDGLGAQNLNACAEVAPSLRGARTISSVFPSTTPAGLGSFGTGLLPGTHGLVSAVFRDPDSNELITPLHWRDEPNPVAYQPHATVFERLARRGVSVHSIGPGEYATSGLTRSVLRGAQYLAAQGITERIDHAAHVASAPGITYVYWAELDRVGHVHGARSEQWREALADVEQLVSGLRAAIPVSAGLIVTADHGMMDCEHTLHIDDDVMLTAGVQTLAGEPRARFVYAQPGVADEVLHRWKLQCEGFADVVGRDEFAALYPELDDDIADRLPDVIAVAHDGVVLASRTFDDRVSRLRGQHGGTSALEIEIPLVVL